MRRRLRAQETPSPSGSSVGPRTLDAGHNIIVDLSMKRIPYDEYAAKKGCTPVVLNFQPDGFILLEIEDSGKAFGFDVGPPAGDGFTWGKMCGQLFGRPIRPPAHRPGAGIPAQAQPPRPRRSTSTLDVENELRIREAIEQLHCDPTIVTTADAS